MAVPFLGGIVEGTRTQQRTAHLRHSQDGGRENCGVQPVALDDVSRLVADMGEHRGLGPGWSLYGRKSGPMRRDAEALQRPNHLSCGLTDCYVDSLGFSECGTRACSSCGFDDLERVIMNPSRERCLTCGANQKYREGA